MPDVLICRSLNISTVSLPQAFHVTSAQQLHSDTDTGASNDGGDPFLYPDLDSWVVKDLLLHQFSTPPNDDSVSHDPNVVGFVPAFLFGSVHLCKLPRRYVAKSHHHCYILCSNLRPPFNPEMHAANSQHLSIHLTAYTHMPLQSRCTLSPSVSLTW